MGCCASTNETAKGTSQSTRPPKGEGYENTGTGSESHVVGQSTSQKLSDEEKLRQRELAAAAAQKRQDEASRRGGLSDKKVAQLKERQRADDLQLQQGGFGQQQENIARMLD